MEKLAGPLRGRGWRVLRWLAALLAVIVAIGLPDRAAFAAAYTLNCSTMPAASGPNSLEKNGTSGGGTAVDTLTINNLASGSVVTFSMIATNGGNRLVDLALTSGSGSGPTPSSFSLTANNQTASSTFNATATGTAAFSITLTNQASGLRGVTWTATCAAGVTLSPSSLPNGTVGTSYSQTITASGGTSPYSYAVTSGGLPAGLSLSSGGVLSGTPTAGGTFNFTVTATDSTAAGSGGPFVGNLAYTLTIAAPTITVSPATLPSGTFGSSYSQTITASGGTSTYSFAVTSGALPGGLTLAAGGGLTGTPTAAGTFNFTVTATDSSTGTGPYTGARAYTLTIAAPTITLSPASLPGGTVGTAYSQTVTASGGTSSYSFAVTAGTLPAGLTLSSGGGLSGTPTAGGTFNFTVTATDSTTAGNGGPFTGNRAYSVTIAAPAITVSPSTLPSGTFGSSYSQTITASGGTSTYSFAVTSGALPGGLTLASGGGLTGTPTAAGTFNFTVTATDSSTGTGPYTGSRAYALTIAAPTITVSPASPLTSGFEGVAYSNTITASGGTSSYSFAVTAGALPSGVSLSSGGGLSGTPTANGTFNFTVTATDSTTAGNGGPFSGNRAYALTINAAPVITTASPLTSGTFGTSYSETIAATGGATPYTFTIDSGSLPSGLTLATGGGLTGAPTAAGTFNFVARVTGADGGTSTQAFSLTIAAPTIAVSPGSLPGGTVGTSYSQTVTASGGTSSYSFAVTAGALPPGMSLASGGALTGTPTAGGTFNFTVTATDSTTAGNGGPFTGSQAYSVAIAAPTIALAPATLPSGTFGSSYSQTLTASGGTSSYSFAVTSGALPAGLTLSSGGVLSGTPTASGSFNFTVTATDSSGGTGPYTGALAYSLVINAAGLTVSPSTLSNGTVGVAYSDAVTASGGTSPYTFAVTAGALPAGVTLSPGGGLSGTPTAGGTFNFTVTATDSTGAGSGGPFSGSRAYTVTIASPTIAVSPATLPAGTFGSSYSQSITASGGTAPYTFAVTSGSLPAGLTLATGGVLSGTPVASGTFNFTVTATDSSTGTGPYTGARAYTLTIGVPTISVSPGSVANGTVGTSYTQTLTGSGGTSPYTFSVTAGALPPGLSLTAGGSLSGTPTAGGTFNFTATATDSTTAGDGGPYSGSQAYSVTIASPTITVSPGTLPSGTFGSSYSQTITALGGTASYSFAVTSGTLPPGLSLASGGGLTGTPTAAGTFNFTVTATDNSTGTGPYTGARAYALTIGPPTIAVSPATLADGTVGTSYSQTVTASGGTSAYGFAVTAGALPPGLSLASGGGLTGTPTAGGTFNFTVTATDSTTAGNGGPFTSSQAYTVAIAAPTITLAPATLPSGTFGSSYSQSITASGGAGSYTFAVTSGSLPGGVTLLPDGTLSGTPTAAGAFNFTVTATDSSTGTGPYTGSLAYALTIGAPAIAVSPGTLPGGTVGSAYSQTVTASGGTSPYAFTVTAGSLPPGLTLATGGGLSGTPTAGGTFNFTVTATDSTTAGNGGPFSGNQAYTVTIASPTIAVAPGSLPSASFGSSYSQSITASGGTGPYTFAVTSGALPAGVTLAPDGTLSGTPAASGNFNFTVTATDASGGTGPYTGAQAYALTIAAPTIAVSPGSLPGGTVGTSYSQTVTASGGTSSYSFAVTAGALPPGMSLASGGALTGTPTAGGTFNFTVTATDSTTAGNGGPFTGSQAYSVAIAAPTIALAPATLPSGTFGSSYSQTVTASGGTGSYSFAVTAGALPAGVTLLPDGTLSGTPTATGTFNFTVTATDSSGGTGPYTGSLAYALVINAAGLTVSPNTLANGTVGVAYSDAVAASGGTSPYSFAVTAGALPPGVTLAPGGGLSGTPTAGGTFNFTVTATDSTGAGSGGPFSGSQAYTVTVASPTVAVAPGSLPSGTFGANYSETITASGGTSAYSFAITSGALPAGLTLAPGGLLSGTPTASGTFNFTVTATDSSTGTGPYTGVQAYTLTIAAPTIALSPASPLTSGFEGVAYSDTITATGGTSTYTFAVTSGALPAGLSLSSSGALSGTPTASGTFNFTVTATDSTTAGDGGPFTGNRAYALTIDAAPSITTASPLTGGTFGASYSATIAATGGTTPYTFTVDSGSLPGGLTLATDGTLSGTPTAAGTFNFAVRVTGADGATSTAAFALTIASPTITVSPGLLPDSTVGASYSQTISASGGTSSYGFAVTAGTLPTGLSLTSGGALSGTPTATGTFNFTVTATDSTTAGNGGPFSGSQAYTVTVGAPTIAVLPGSLPGGTVGTSYSQTVTASGGTSSRTFAVTAGTLPPGLSLASGGAVTGTPTAGGTFNFTVTATDSTAVGDGGPFTGSQAYAVTIAAPTIAIGPGALPSGSFGSSYSQSITASGGTGPYSFAVTSGALPAGVTLLPDGTLSGTPTASGSFNFTVAATDSSGGTGPYTGSLAYTLTINAAGLTVSPNTLANGTVGAAYSGTVTASGGTSPYTFAITAGALPPGVTLASGGGLSGTPTAGGTFNFTVTATDDTGAGSGGPFSGSNAYTVTVASPTIAVAPGSLPPGTFGASYNETITALGGTGPYTFAVTSGSLPGGLTLATGGALTGTPTASGTFNFTVTATDASTGTGPYTAAQAYTLTIGAPTIAVSPGSLTSGTVGTSYSQTLTGSGGTGPYGFAVTAGALPPGVTLLPDGTLSGTPTAGGTFNFTVTATDGTAIGDGGPFSGSQAYSVTMAAPTLTVSPGLLPPATFGSNYNQTITASGGTGPYSFAVTSGALPPGVTLLPDGTLSGTPTSAGTFNFTITATDSSTGTGPFTGALAFTLTSNAPAVAVSPGSLPGGTVGTSYSQTVTASGGTGPYTFAVTAGALPPGLTLTAAGGLAGTPTAGGAFNFTVTATDNTSAGSGGPFAGSQAFAVTIAAPTLTVSPGSLPAGTFGSGFNQTITASGGTGPYTFAVTGGALPPGVTLLPDGTLSGTPTASGAFNFTITATDSSGGTGPFSGSATYSLTVNAPTVAVSPGSLPGGTVGSPYNQTVTASGGTGPYSFAVTGGALPGGLTLASGGGLTGTPTTGGTFNFTVTATDSTSPGNGGPFSGSQAYTVSIGATSQTISATNPGTVPLVPGGTVTLSASASSGLPLTYVSTTPGVCTVSGATVTMLTAGTCSITISQPGDGSFGPAPGVVVTFGIGKVPQSAFTATANPPVIPVGGNTRIVTSGGSGTGKVTIAITSGARNCRLQGNKIIATRPGTCIVKVTKAGDGTYLPSTDTVTITIEKPETVTTLATAPNPSNEGQRVTLTAVISPKVPNGTLITFKSGSTVIGTAQTKNGKARLATADLPAGRYTIKAVTPETELYLGSVSDPVTQVVTSGSRKKTVETIASFLERRNDLILKHDPDTPRQIDRLKDFNDAEAAAGETGFAAAPMAPAGWSGSSIVGVPGLAPSDYGFDAASSAPNVAHMPLALMGRSDGGTELSFSTSLSSLSKYTAEHEVERVAAALDSGTPIAVPSGGKMKPSRFDAWIEGHLSDIDDQDFEQGSRWPVWRALCRRRLGGELLASRRLHGPVRLVVASVRQRQERDRRRRLDGRTLCDAAAQREPLLPRPRGVGGIRE